MNKTAIKNFAVWARKKLIEDISYKARLFGVSDKEIAKALPQSTNDLKFFDIGTKDYTEVSGKKIKQREALISAIKTKERDTKNYKEAYEYIIEEVAYTWFNRLIAIRFMEVNEYLPSGIRVLSSENKAKNEPDFVTNPFEAELDLTIDEQEKILYLKEQNKSDELFRMLFIKQCNKLHEILPDLFENTNDYSELLLTISFTDKDGIIYHLTHDIDENDFNVEKEGQIEIIGWLYQYYNIEPKAEVFARPKGKKIKKEQVPAATQLFTPNWIVRYMVENSLGRLWYEGHSDSNIKDNWKYYLNEEKQELDVQTKLNTIKEEYKSLKPEGIKLIDPCMGSGHILIYVFDVLMQIYESYGYTPRDAASLIIENNLFGLDIDKRAAQLAYFAVMMKGRQYDRRFLTRGLKPHIYDIPDMEDVHPDIINVFGDCSSIAQRVCDSFAHGKEYGSLIVPNISLEEIEKLNEQINDMQSIPGNIFSQIALSMIIPLMDIVKMLVQKYDIVITNPPYMAVSNANVILNEYIKQYYPDSKADIFAVFIERCMEMIKQNRFQAMITMHSWMFLSSFEKLREKLLQLNIINMAHLGARAFEEIGGEVVQTTSFILQKNNIKNYKGMYCRLIEPTTQKGKEEMYLTGENRFGFIQDNFPKIPGSPIAYWINESLLQSFIRGEMLKVKGDTRQGMATSDNNRFLRLWFEIENNKLGLNYATSEEAISSQKKWYPYNKGGEYRKWYGNIEYTINYENNGYEVKQYAMYLYKTPTRTIKSISEYFKPCLSWSKISSGNIAFRYYPKGFIFDVAGCCIFYIDENTMLYDFGFLNSLVSKSILTLISPTLNYEAGHIATLPLIREQEYIDRVNKKVISNIEVARKDWDSYETSWDFTLHPIMEYKTGSGYGTDINQWSYRISDAYTSWKEICNERFRILKLNEEELNRIFIDIYGLQDELTPDVLDKDITVHRIFDTKDDIPESMKGSNYIRTKRDEIVSLISYAVGCIFGRYSLDIEGLAYAGGEWDISKYHTFVPNADNCIPITDELYFEEDIVGCFEEFIRVAYGEDTLEENLDFIANALGNKGNTSREIIRNYFLKGFMKDHIKNYQKRPIYWLFDSGKQNGFKALVYMHRWDEDTIGHIRIEHLHRMQHIYEKEIERMQDIIDNSHNNKEVNVATKRKEKLQKQLKETKDYDTLIAHLALSRIDIDLDDGVKVNYEKVQTGIDGKKIQVLEKI